ncbi:bifunctional diguanylate cyclase/phosphodiesterase [Hydrogenophaga soli]
MLFRVLVCVAVALAYVASGWLSLQISTPPHYISMVFLPAGVALGAMLVWGWWAAPGVWLGSAVVQWLASGQLPMAQWPLTVLLSPFGAVVQAGLTAALARRFGGYPHDVDTPRRTLLFMLVLVPLGHCLNASLSVPLLVHSGAMPPAEAAFSWWAWWQGDALGAVLVTPLMLVAFGRPAESWRPRWKTVALPMVLALAVVAVSFSQILRSEQRALAQRFDQASHALRERLQRRLDAQTDAVLAVTRLKELTSDEDPRTFELTTSIWLNRYAGTQNFGWSPWVNHADRSAFETLARTRHRAALGGTRYEIRGRNQDGQTFVAPPSAAYLPILFVEPLEPNRSVLGLDVMVLPATARAVRAALNSGQPQVTEGIRLVQETGEQRGVVMYQAAYDPTAMGPSSLRVRGVVSAVFRMDDVLQAALEGLDTSYLTVCLIDPQAPAANQRLSGPLGCEEPDGMRPHHFVSLPVHFGERQWLFQVASGSHFETQERGWISWVTLTVSLMAVGLLGVFLIVQTGHARRTEQLVVARTRELAQSNEGLHRLAMFDPLTGLANRLHWVGEARKALDAARRHGDRLAVLFVDLDHFKDVNDSLGHNMGDLLLQAVSQRLQACMRSHDLMARQGGDEFVVLLNRLRSRDDAAAVATKMIEQLTQPFTLHEHEVHVSASIGVAWFEGGHADVDALLRHADMAMYQAKASGRNGWSFFEPQMDQSVAQRVKVESGLRRALVQNELVLHYQPQMDCATGQIVGVEALVRWQHPDGGLLMPDQFVPQAEANGQIDELGAWVMREAFGQWRRWQQQGITGLTMAVNVSAVEFGRPTFIPRLRQILDETGADPDWLELEITETALMQALPELVERLGDMARMGVRLSLDDFGTGYSSLGYLKRLPLNSLKIDRSFVHDLPGDKEDEAIVCATLSMARALGLSVVAEGVELPEQRSFLAQQGCNLIQGWLVARPMDARAFEAWWASHGGR